MTTPDFDMNLVEQAARNLGEHFDCVQIFCSRHEEGEAGGTVAVCWGVGNEFARWGQAKLWVDAEHRSPAAGAPHKKEGEP